MTDSSAESAGAPGQDDACSHPWLRVVCGECGRPLDILGLDVIHPAVRAKESAESAAGPGERRTGVFVVARGHPELVEQLRVALGQSGGVQVIGASADQIGDRTKVLEFIKQAKLNFPIWLGATTADMQRL